MEPPIKDPLRYGQPPNKDVILDPFPIAVVHLTSEKRTTSQRRRKWLVPKCPLFGGSNVYNIELAISSMTVDIIQQRFCFFFQDKRNMHAMSNRMAGETKFVYVSLLAL